MSDEKYEIGIKWENRHEGAEACAGRLAGMLKALESLDPVFAQWFTDAERVGDGAVPAKPLRTGADDITRFFEQGKCRKDTGALWPELGCSVMAWNGIDGPKTLAFFAQPGHYSDTRDFPNSVDFEIQPRAAGNRDFMTAEIIRAILIAAIVAWEPAWGSVSTWEYWGQRYPPPQQWPDFRSGWMTYLSAPYARKVTPPSSAITEPVAGGILMLATEEPFTLDNPQHVAVADAIQACLEPLQSNPRIFP
jgi:hypothetical protein